MKREKPLTLNWQRRDKPVEEQKEFFESRNVQQYRSDYQLKDDADNNVLMTDASPVFTYTPSNTCQDY